MQVVFRVREQDRGIFEAIKSGEKDVETRAATDKYQQIEVGDYILIVCGKHRIAKTVKSRRHFSSLEKLLEQVDFKRIIPGAHSVDEAKSVWLRFPGYREKIAKFGLMAFEI